MYGGRLGLQNGKMLQRMGQGLASGGSVGKRGKLAPVFEFAGFCASKQRSFQ